MLRLLGQKLLTSKGEILSSTLSTKQGVAFYFSASWCPPCQKFTPLLVDTYAEINEEHPNALEIVFVSGDHDAESFEKYFKKMPWPAVDYKDEAVRGNLFNTFGVRGIPALILVDKEGKAVVTNGVDKVRTQGADVWTQWEKLLKPAA